MLKVYGSKMCPDCTELENAFAKAHVAYEYHDITADLRDLKAFLSLRDKNEIFEQVKAQGYIGIPLLVKEDGSLTFRWQELVPEDSFSATGCVNGICGVPQK